MNRTKLILLLVVVASVAWGCSPERNPSVCDITADPHRYVGEFVSITARFEDNGIDRSTLVDPKCPASAIGVITTQEVERTPEFAKLRTILREGLMGTLGKKVTGKFSGRIASSTGEWPQLTLHVVRIDDLFVETVPLSPPE